MVISFFGFVFAVLALITNWRSPLMIPAIVLAIVMFLAGNAVGNSMQDGNRPPSWALILQPLAAVSVFVLFVVGLFV